MPRYVPAGGGGGLRGLTLTGALQGLLKFKHFYSLASNFGPALPNTRKRLCNVSLVR